MRKRLGLWVFSFHAVLPDRVSLSNVAIGHRLFLPSTSALQPLLLYNPGLVLFRYSGLDAHPNYL